jgi:hypothetical protein
MASLGLASSLACGMVAIASAVTSDAMSPAISGGTALGTNGFSPRDESVAHNLDDNSDDMPLVSSAGLEVEIELPKELVEPIEARVEAPGVTR